MRLNDFGHRKEIAGDHAICGAGAERVPMYYLAPEWNASALADVYALGIIAYEIVTGKVPFADSNPIRLNMKHMVQELPPIKLPEANLPETLVQFIDTCTAKKPKERFQSMKEVVAYLDKRVLKL